ncbi:hypothetical protein CERSUDRAFT_120356 [Gelatoporia subvermispora B]|uniref:Uncharacterized protein n=1 Tax=Ceriporiopsis subvermispora (strain B) TaxID=914234 RepID=M2QF59_CERS8|nr:hypothetical protein CERSUDRAFT_120356 [Gelatoporia subvermispora B]
MEAQGGQEAGTLGPGVLDAGYGADRRMGGATRCGFCAAHTRCSLRCPPPKPRAQRRAEGHAFGVGRSREVGPRRGGPTEHRDRQAFAAQSARGSGRCAALARSSGNHGHRGALALDIRAQGRISNVAHTPPCRRRPDSIGRIPPTSRIWKQDSGRVYDNGAAVPRGRPPCTPRIMCTATKYQQGRGA